MKKALKVILLVIAVPALYVAGNLLYATLTDYQPRKETSVFIRNASTAAAGDTVSVLIWNIGFTGLGNETDFFYDGGKVVTQEAEIVTKNREGIKAFITNHRDVDFILFQEIDSIGKRSHGFNHLDEMHGILPSHSSAFAMNYNVDFVPVPFLDPMGKVKSGVATYSKNAIVEAKRYGFESQMDWPTRLYFLDRCFLATPTQTKSGKDLLVLNTHCSAYDTAGTMVANEVSNMMKVAREAYANGAHVIAGGDWNQCPPNYTPIDPNGTYGEFNLQPDQLDEGWKWIADPSTPTNRKLNTKYNEDCYTSVIDHFFISPNVEVIDVKTIDLNFKYSDHQPVLLRAKLN